MSYDIARHVFTRPLEYYMSLHVTNEEVFNRANTKPTLLDGLLKRRLAFHGHLVRKDGITLDLMIGRLHGTRPRGRPRTTWLRDLATQANISYKEAITIPTTYYIHGNTVIIISRLRHIIYIILSRLWTALTQM